FTFFLTCATIAFRDGAMFGTSDTAHARLNLGTPPRATHRRARADAHATGRTLTAYMPPRWGDGVVPSYNAIAEQLRRGILRRARRRAVRLAATAKKRGRVCDLDCGPGQIARYLAAHGVDAFGIDASASTVATARRLNQHTLGFFAFRPARSGRPEPCRSVPLTPLRWP